MHQSRSSTTLLVFVALFCGLCRSAQAADPSVKPNIIMILADDLGWGDLGCYGHPHIKTPHLDRLAKRGTQFTNFYTNGLVCSPSRCALFTGQYPARHRIHGHYATREQNADRGMSNWLDPEVPNVARQLKGAGYATAHIGKWHLGNNSGGPAIESYGFDFVGTSERDGPNGPADDPHFRARSSALFVDEGLRFIAENKDKPFYLQIWTLVAHATLRPTDEQMKPYEQFRAGGKDFPHRSAAEIYYASVTDLDAQIGRLIVGLEKLGLTNQTLIVFSSDNGPEDIHVGNASHSGIGSAGPFRGRKRSLYEGGVRVPGIVCWPGHVPAERVDGESVVAGVDWLPTVCRLAGAEIPDAHSLDGEDVSDVMLGQSRARAKPLMWEWRFGIAGELFHHSPMLAIREGGWKLLMNPDRSRVELYDVERDPSELSNVAQQEPELVEQLATQALAWQKKLPSGPVHPSAGGHEYPWPGKSRPPRGDAGAKGKR